MAHGTASNLLGVTSREETLTIPHDSVTVTVLPGARKPESARAFGEKEGYILHDDLASKQAGESSVRYDRS
jgi:hypothetical protein